MTMPPETVPQRTAYVDARLQVLIRHPDVEQATVVAGDLPGLHESSAALGVVGHDGYVVNQVIEVDGIVGVNYGGNRTEILHAAELVDVLVRWP